MQNVFIVLDTTGYVKALMRASQDYVRSSRQLHVTEHEVTHEPYQVHNVTGYVTSVHDRDTTIEIPPPPALTRQRALLMITTLINEVVSQTVRYRQAIDPLPELARALRDCALPEQYDLLLAEHFLTEPIVDETVIELHRYVTAFIKDDPWREWDIVTSHNMVALVGGQDYRIADWERRHGADNQTGAAVSVDMSDVANYIRQQMIRQLGLDAASIPVSLLIMDAITRRFPMVSFPQRRPIPDMILEMIGVRSYEAFYREFAGTVMETFSTTFLSGRLNPNQPYTAELSTNFTMDFYNDEPTHDAERRYCEEVRRSLDHGDWVPPRDIRRLEAYERQHA